jgi:hypothetical protein
VALLAPITASAQTAVPDPTTSAAVSVAPAVEAERRALGIDDFEQWRSISSVAISDDGRWATFAYQRRKADDTLYVRELETERVIAVPRASRPKFSDDARWVAYFVSPTYTDVEKLEREKKPVPLKVELRSLETGEAVAEWDDVDTFEFASGSALLAVHKKKADAKAEHDGADLILRDLRRGHEELIGSVADHAFNDTGSHLAYVIATASREGTAVPAGCGHIGASPAGRRARGLRAADVG